MKQDKSICNDQFRVFESKMHAKRWLRSLNCDSLSKFSRNKKLNFRFSVRTLTQTFMENTSIAYIHPNRAQIMWKKYTRFFEFSSSTYICVEIYWMTEWESINGILYVSVTVNGYVCMCVWMSSRIESSWVHRSLERVRCCSVLCSARLYCIVRCAPVLVYCNQFFV